MGLPVSDSFRAADMSTFVTQPRMAPNVELRDDRSHIRIFVVRSLSVFFTVSRMRDLAGMSSMILPARRG